MKKVGILLILSALALALSMALAGCGSEEPTTSQSSTAPASTETKPSAPPSPATPVVTTPPAQEHAAAEAPATQPDESTATVTQPETPAVQPKGSNPSALDADTDPSETFSKSIQALQSLTSYRYTTTMKYEGTDGSADDSGTITVLGEYSAPDRYHITLNDSSEDEKSEFVKIGDSLWVYSDGEWTKVPDMAVATMSQSIFSFGLSFVWGSLAEGLETGSNYIGKETVNGINSLHYSSTNSDWEKGIEAGFQNAHGDVWVAEAGYPVKFVFTASGTDEDGNSGSMEWRSDVTDVNAEVTISAPAVSE